MFIATTWIETDSLRATAESQNVTATIVTTAPASGGIHLCLKLPLGIVFQSGSRSRLHPLPIVHPTSTADRIKRLDQTAESAQQIVKARIVPNSVITRCASPVNGFRLVAAKQIGPSGLRVAAGNEFRIEQRFARVVAQLISVQIDNRPTRFFKHALSCGGIPLGGRPQTDV